MAYGSLERNRLEFTRMKVPYDYYKGHKTNYLSATEYTVESGLCASDTNDWQYGLDSTTTVDITVTGAGGLQTSSSEANDTWYGIYIIADSNGTNDPSVLLIPDGTAFSESGYDMKRRVGWIRNDGSGDFFESHMYMKGNTRHIIWKEGDPRELA